MQNLNRYAVTWRHYFPWPPSRRCEWGRGDNLALIIHQRHAFGASTGHQGWNEMRVGSRGLLAWTPHTHDATDATHNVEMWGKVWLLEEIFIYFWKIFRWLWVRSEVVLGWMRTLGVSVCVFLGVWVCLYVCVYLCVHLCCILGEWKCEGVKWCWKCSSSKSVQTCIQMYKF